MKNNSITIVGAGLAGSLLSIYMAKLGIKVTMFERRPDMRQHQISAGRSINLALSNRGLRALERVGLADDVKNLIIPMRGRMLHEPDSDPYLQPYGKNEQEVIYSVSRPGLNALLLDEAEKKGVEILFEHTLSHVDLNTSTITLSDNQGHELKHKCEPLIATDGSGSLTRRTLGFAPGSSSAEEFLEHGYKELTIPASGDGAFQMEANALHIWPRGGFMLIALPNLDGSFTVTLFMPREGQPSFASLKDSQSVQQFFASTFPDALELMPQLAQEFFEHPTGRLVTVRCKPWYFRDKILLLGDAAHAIVPFHGQGMNCAFEDCLILDEIMQGETNDNTDWRAVFALFQSRRLKNANAIADLALENYVVMRDSVRDPRFHLKKELSWELEKRFPACFIPRYSMVMFHHIPYALAQSRGEVQEQILEQLIGEQQDLSQVNYNLAKTLIDEQLGKIL